MEQRWAAEGRRQYQPARCAGSKVMRCTAASAGWPQALLPAPLSTLSSWAAAAATSARPSSAASASAWQKQRSRVARPRACTGSRPTLSAPAQREWNNRAGASRLAAQAQQRRHGLGACPAGCWRVEGLVGAEAAAHGSAVLAGSSTRSQPAGCRTHPPRPAHPQPGCQSAAPGGRAGWRRFLQALPGCRGRWRRCRPPGHPEPTARRPCARVGGWEQQGRAVGAGGAGRRWEGRVGACTEAWNAGGRRGQASWQASTCVHWPHAPAALT